MPKIDGMGQSPETAVKQKHFHGLLWKQMTESKGVMAKQYRWCDSSYYQYFDLYSGAGWWIDADGREQKGSPLIFLDIVEELDIPYRAHFIDIKRCNVDRLIDSVPRYHHEFCSFTCDDNTMAMRTHLRAMTWKDKRDNPGRRMGAIYVDPNAGTDINWELLEMINRVEWHERTDIIINVGATSIKRVRARYPDLVDWFLTEKMKSIGKKKWLVREPRGRWQWTFLIGTNWADMNAWGKKRFYDCETDDGKRILDILNYSKNEKDDFDDADQLGLFDI